jgi:hypothetical protein
MVVGVFVRFRAPLLANKRYYGSTERIIGTWLKKSGKEKRLFGKIAGPNPNFGYMRKS